MNSDWVAVIKDILLFVSSLTLPFIAYYIRKLEKNTNSIKDALVIASYKAGQQAGKDGIV